MNDSDRQQLRQQMRQARRGITGTERDRAEQAINQQLIGMTAFRDAGRIALYSAFDGEPSMTASIDAALASGKLVFLPVLPASADAPLSFAPIEPASHTQTNRHGILEPAVGAESFIAADQLDLVITPLVAFDPQGNRLGMGAGYYDRTFAFTVNQAPASTRLIGVAFQRQKHSALDPQPWDVPLWRIVTETRQYPSHKKATEN
ncbi:MAG: 5-formyltetrahydrofolate cyclo-ligase [Pseudomonadota bacterium]